MQAPLPFIWSKSREAVNPSVSIEHLSFLEPMSMSEVEMRWGKKEMKPMIRLDTRRRHGPTPWYLSQKRLDKQPLFGPVGEVGMS